ncbi:MAG: hypothetical protein DCC55_23880 [Chloroflexi bacterium]|nr:MAG: hypothetical protein DCC55_23880 [Chloroflexota bacterium]
MHNWILARFIVRLSYMLVVLILCGSVLPAQAQEPENADGEQEPQPAVYLPVVTGPTAGVPAADARNSDFMLQHLLPQQPKLFSSTIGPARTAIASSADMNRPLAAGLYRLSGFDPDLSLNDLEPLRQIIGQADFVGLGEPVHTTGGAYQMKHRIFRFLVERMGFRVLGFESPYLWVERLDHYVQTCQGSPADALRGNLFSVFNSTEVADLVQWMCEWNQAHPHDRVYVYGFDIQSMGRESAEALITFLTRLGFSADDPRITGIRLCDGVVDTSWRALPFPQERYLQCQDTLDDVALYLSQHELSIRSQASAEELGWARVHLYSERAWQEQIFRWNDFELSFVARDLGMAYLARAIRDVRFPGARVALWAHDGHVARNGANFLFYSGLGRSPAMGDFLKLDLGADYVTIGITGLQVHVDWPAVGLCGPLDLRGKNAIEDAFASTGEPYLLLDLASRGNGRETFLDPYALYSIIESRPIVPKTTFDALIYIENSPAMQPLRWPPCQ